MSKTIKDTDSIYKKARIKASEFNQNFKSREGASQDIGVSKDQLMNYELGVCKQIPMDVVVKMAEIYNTPELMNFYCCNECPIGKHIAREIKIAEIDRLTIELLSSFRDVPDVKDSLINIVADGVITEEEKPQLDKVLKFLDSLSEKTESLKLWAMKNLK